MRDVEQNSDIELVTEISPKISTRFEEYLIGKISMNPTPRPIILVEERIDRICLVSQGPG